MRWLHRRNRPRMVPCACGCGRLLPHNSPWDGYHGPGPLLGGRADADRDAPTTPEIPR